MKLTFKTSLFSAIALIFIILSCQEDGVDRPKIPDAQPPVGVPATIAFPDASSIGQDVHTIPLIIFKYIPEDVHSVQFREERFRLILDAVTLETDTEVPTTREWTADNDSLKLIPNGILQPNTLHTVTVTTHWEVDKGDGVWMPVLIDGQTAYVTKNLTFTTKDFDLTRISSDYMEAVYPVPNQLNFLKSEYSKGYMMLNSGLQNYLFDTNDGSLLVARFTSQAAGGMDVPLTFDESSLTLSHDIPADLVNETIYRLQYLKVAAGGTEQEIYRLHFRTSKFNTFPEKVSEFTFSQTHAWEHVAGRTELYEFVENQTEAFDLAETRVEFVTLVSAQIHYSVGLIRFEALPGNAWYDEKVYPLVYSEFESSGLRQLVTPYWKRPSSLPVPPLNGLYVRRKELSSDDVYVNFRQLTEADIESNQIEPIAAPAEIVYNVANLAYRDWQTFRSQANNVTPQTAYSQTLWNNTSFPNLTRGEYKAKLKYVLPGKTEPTSEVDLSFNY